MKTLIILYLIGMFVAWLQIMAAYRKEKMTFNEKVFAGILCLLSWLSVFTLFLGRLASYNSNGDEIDSDEIM